MKKALKVVLCVLGAVVALAALGILFLTITEYRPADVEQLEVISEEHDGGAADPVSPQLQAGEELTVLSWNIGYAGLGEDEDFFMDGGTKKTSADKATVEKYLNGISDTLGALCGEREAAADGRAGAAGVLRFSVSIHPAARGETARILLGARYPCRV